MTNLSITLFKKSEESFKQLLDEQGITYQTQTPNFSAPVNMPGSVIEITQAVMSSGAFWPSLAYVIVHWLKQKNSRIIDITKKDGTHIRLEGNIEQKHIDEALEQAKSIRAIDTK